MCFFAGEVKSDTFGILEYLLVFPVLLKLLVKNNVDYGYLTLLAFFFHVIKVIIALIMTMPLLPLLYLAYRCIRYQSIKAIEDMEILPVGIEALEFLEYNTSYIGPYATHGMNVSKEKLCQILYSDKNSKIKLKDHLKFNEIQKNSMEDYTLYTMGLKGASLPILGLFDTNNLPIAIIMLCKENKKGVLALERIDAFHFLNMDYLGDNILSYYLNEEDPINFHQWLNNRQTKLFASQQAMETAAIGTGLANLTPSIDPLIALEIMRLSGDGSQITISRDTEFLSAFRNKFFTTKNPSIKEEKKEDGSFNLEESLTEYMTL